MRPKFAAPESRGEAERRAQESPDLDDHAREYVSHYADADRIPDAGGRPRHCPVRHRLYRQPAVRSPGTEDAASAAAADFGSGALACVIELRQLLRRLKQSSLL